jgi:hypothetical protein
MLPMSALGAPTIEEDEDNGDRDPAARLGQDDVPERLEAVRAVEERGLLHLVRNVLDSAVTSGGATAAAVAPVVIIAA